MWRLSLEFFTELPFLWSLLHIGVWSVHFTSSNWGWLLTTEAMSGLERREEKDRCPNNTSQESRGSWNIKDSYRLFSLLLETFVLVHCSQGLAHRAVAWPKRIPKYVVHAKLSKDMFDTHSEVI